MAGHRAGLLAILTGTLLVSVWGWGLVSPVHGGGTRWEVVNKTQLNKSDRELDWDDSDFSVGLSQVSEVEDASEDFDPYANSGYHVEYIDPSDSDLSNSDASNLDPNAHSGYHVEYIDPSNSDLSDFDLSNFDPLPEFDYPGEYIDTSNSDISNSEFKFGVLNHCPSVVKSLPGGLEVICGQDEFRVTLPSGSISEIKVLGSDVLLPVQDAPQSCGYDLDLLDNTLTVPFSGCHVKQNAESYTLQLLYINVAGQTDLATASCEARPRFKCSNTAPTHKRSPVPQVEWKQSSNSQGCSIPKAEQVTCGSAGISSSECEKLGCCVDSSTSACYYPMDECTDDKKFIFSIRHNSASVALDPTKLVIPGKPSCKPVVVNDKVAIFKFSVTDCATRSYQVGETQIYLAEVQTIVEALNLKFGAITRSNPLRFYIECRYPKSGSANKQSLASIGYMVRSPSMSPPQQVIFNGKYGVELRIAKDQSYSSYYPTYHQPLRLLLGKPVHLELRLKSPRPDAVVLVNYCLAYPRSAKNALVLIYEGCANRLDPNVSILKVSDLPKNRHQRRFVVKAFQFMDQKTNKYLNEEIYFMCSTEVCKPELKTCAERCFDGKSPS
uniref:ZP domain-containing protein n=1 Tax=Myripristis murdjan TaxID=586833 RepID=A0A667WV88_9TELE